jgi:hypothetical protein
MQCQCRESSLFSCQSLYWLSTLYLDLQVVVGLEATPEAAFRTDAVKYAFIGLMRDLRGITMATNRYILSQKNC